MTERLTEDYFDDMQKITRHYAKSNNIDLNTGGNDFQDIIDKLAEYETAEDEGRLVVLPCKVGETLFCFSRGKIYPFKVRCIRIYEERTEIELWYAGDEENLKFWHITIAEQDIGYKFFFIREEAEKASREMEEKS